MTRVPPEAWVIGALMLVAALNALRHLPGIWK